MADVETDKISSLRQQPLFSGLIYGIFGFLNLLRRSILFGVRSEKQLKDFVRGTSALFWQRQFMYVSAGALAGYYYDAWTSLLCVMLCEVTEMIDVFISLKVARWKGKSRRVVQTYHLLLFCSSVLSAVAVAYFAFTIARMEGPSVHFAPMFFLFAAGLFAAVNNHQLPLVLYARLVIYGAVFLFIPIRDLIEVRPPFNDELWMQFLTIVFVLYFVVDCSRIFLKLYQKNLDQLDDLREERDRAKVAYETKSQFVSTVSHELRTPLTSIKGSLDLIQSGILEGQPEKRDRLIKLAYGNSKRLADLINDILDFQKLESGKMTYDFRVLNYADCIEDAVNSVSGMADKKNVQISVGTIDHSLYVRADQRRIVQVIVNVLSNAVKFSDGAERVEVELTASDGNACLKVRDYGIGIPENSQQKVFGLFHQIDSSDHRRFDGTGLGMSISNDIMQAHDGRVHYISETGQGTSFFIELPLHDVEGTGN